MATRICKNNPNDFCYICGHHIKSKSRKYSLSGVKLQEAYESYFKLKLTHDIEKSWAPQYSCSYCANNLKSWLAGTKKSNFNLIALIFHVLVYLLFRNALCDSKSLERTKRPCE